MRAKQKRYVCVHYVSTTALAIFTLLLLALQYTNDIQKYCRKGCLCYEIFASKWLFCTDNRNAALEDSNKHASGRSKQLSMTGSHISQFNLNHFVKLGSACDALLLYRAT
jgi:hypothetical protein